MLVVGEESTRGMFPGGGNESRYLAVGRDSPYLQMVSNMGGMGGWCSPLPAIFFNPLLPPIKTDASMGHPSNLKMKPPLLESQVFFKEMIPRKKH